MLAQFDLICVSGTLKFNWGRSMRVSGEKVTEITRLPPFHPFFIRVNDVCVGGWLQGVWYVQNIQCIPLIHTVVMRSLCAAF